MYTKLFKGFNMKSNFATVTSKGQVTIPLTIRDKLHLSAGSKIEYILHGNYVMIVPINNSATKLKGMLPKPSKSLSIEEMDDFIRKMG